MKTVILVNGIPASGKSTLAHLIANTFNFPYLSIDTIKEPFMDMHETITREYNRELGKAAYKVIWDTVTQAPENCIYVIDAWFGFQPKELLQYYLEMANVDNIIEIWNQISPELVVKRYQERLTQRKKGHPSADYLPELAELATKAKPMYGAQSYVVSQDELLDGEQLLKWIEDFIPHASF